MEFTLSGRRWDPSAERLLADGAWGTELQKLGLRQGDCPERMNLEHPELPKSIARSYLDAGSDIVLTNTFGGSSIQLARHGLSSSATEINRIGARLSAEAVFESGKTGNAVVAGDIGPCGKLLVVGEVTEQELYASFSAQAGALREGGATWIVVETMSDMVEMRIAVKAACDAAGLPVVASMTYSRTPSGDYRTMMGNSVEECVAAALDSGASLVGANCGSGIDSYLDLASMLCLISTVPVWIKANAGIPILIDGRVSYPIPPDSYAEYVPSLLASGVAVVGGCCGTSPDYVRRMRRFLDETNKLGR